MRGELHYASGAAEGLALAGRGDGSKQSEAGHCGSRETKLGLGEAVVIVQTRGSRTASRILHLPA